MMRENKMKDLEKLFSQREDTAGKIIQSFRRNFKISQAELCAITGISEKYLSAVENDKRPIGLEVASYQVRETMESNLKFVRWGIALIKREC